MRHETELSSELEWMLGSGQATPAMLAEVLVEHFYAPVYRISLAVLGSGEAATTAFQDALVSAVSRAPRYQQSDSPQVWFFRLVLEAVQAIRQGWLPTSTWVSLKSGGKGSLQPEARQLIAALDQEARLPALFCFGLGWQAGEIASLLGQTVDEVANMLQGASSNLAKEISSMTDPSAAFQAALPAPTLSPEQVHAIASEAALQAKQHGLRTLRLTRLREFSWLIAATLLVVIIGLAWSSWQQALEPSQTPPPPLNTPTPAYEASVPYYARPGETIKSIAKLTGMPLTDLVQLNPGISNGLLETGQLVQVPDKSWTDLAIQSITNDHRPILISGRSTSKEIQKVLENSPKTWKTLWAEAKVTTYTLPMSGGQPTVYNTQILVSQPDHSLLTIVPEDRSSVERIMTDKNKVYFSNRDLSYSWFTDHPDSSIQWSKISELINPEDTKWVKEPGEFSVDGYAIAAGRPAVVIDWQDINKSQQRRLWVDAQTGVILFLRQFLDTNVAITFSEYRIHVIAYDIEVPPQVFSPSNAEKFSLQDSRASQTERDGN